MATNLEKITLELNAVKSDRDGLKNNILEMEIAQHENDEIKKTEGNEINIKVAGLITEKETLEMTLNLRDNEIKKLKEENRRDKETREIKCNDLNETITAKSMKIFAQEAEIKNLKETVVDNAETLRTRNDFIAQLKSTIEDKKDSTKSLQERAEKDEIKIGELNSEIVKLGNELKVKGESFESLQNDFEACVLKLDELSEAKEKLDEEFELVSSRYEIASEKVVQLSKSLKDNEDSFPTRLEQSDIVQNLRKDKKILEDSLEEKKIVIILFFKITFYHFFIF